MISLACQWTQSPSATPLQPIKYMLLFGLCLLMISQAGWWTRTPSATSLQPKKMKSSFLYYIQLLMLARLVDGLKPHPPPVSSQKNEILVFVLHSTSDDKPGWLMDSNPICHPSPAKKVKCSFLDYVQFLMISRAGWWYSNPIHHPSPTKKMKCSFLDYVQLLMIGQAGQWTETTSATSLQPKTWNATFGLCSTSDDRPGWSMDSNPILHPSPAKKVKCSFLYYIQHLMLARLVNGLEPHPPLLPSQKMKCSFLHYIQLLMISQAC